MTADELFRRVQSIKVSRDPDAMAALYADLTQGIRWKVPQSVPHLVAAEHRLRRNGLVEWEPLFVEAVRLLADRETQQAAAARKPRRSKYPTKLRNAVRQFGDIVRSDFPDIKPADLVRGVSAKLEDTGQTVPEESTLRVWLGLKK